MDQKRLSIENTAIAGVHFVSSNKMRDERGAFSRFFCNQELAPLLGDRNIVQINHSYTSQSGTIRGLHMQLYPYQEMKFVRCIRGAVFDVAVDLRRGSETFLSWQGKVLSAENQAMLIIPEGCAHGFQTLESDCELVYLHTAHYEAQSETGVLFNEPRIHVDWPRAVSHISEKDASWRPLSPAFNGF